MANVVPPEEFESVRLRASATPRWKRTFITFSRRHPVLVLVLIAAVSNLTGSVFNIVYNTYFIVNHVMSPEQKEVFHFLALPIYNLIAYPVGLGITVYVLRHVRRNHHRLLKGEEIPALEMELCRRTLINVPFYQIWVNLLCWLPGALFFPGIITWLGGAEEAGEIWWHFFVSFVVAALLTVVQTFFFMEEFLIRVLYPLYFRDSRPADISGSWQFSYFWRLSMLWSAVALAPMAAIVALAENVPEPIRTTMFLTALGGLISGSLISYFVGGSLWRWLREHQVASARIARGEFTTRVPEKRPDEWGNLTDRFNDMAADLEKAEKEHETFGQIVHPEVRDDMMQRYPGMGGAVQEITVMFVDIRGFSRRSEGEPPEKIVALLNRFLTLAVAAIEDKGGWVNKFLGDGVLALFGTRQSAGNQADQALDAALELLQRLHQLNEELRQQGQLPLIVGIGIHTGPALYGCVGATIILPDGHITMRREITAIGETINLGQRVEQLTKTLGGPILLSAATRLRLSHSIPLTALGPQPVPGYQGTLELYLIGDRNQTPVG